jgi:hypothetical protein
MELNQASAKRAVRYLKRVVFPPDAIEYFTVGRNRETRHIAVAMEEVRLGASRHCFVEASYGIGKSHMLKVAEALALSRGFAVCWVTIDGSEHAFNHPTRYVHNLLTSLRVPGVSARGLVELCRYWLANNERNNVLDWAHRDAPWEFRVPIESLAAPGGENNKYGEWYLARLEGRDLQHKSGRYYFTDFYRRLEATVSLCRAVHCAGVLFLFDEIECIATLMNNIRSRLLSYEVLNTLVDGRRFPHSMFLFAATDDLESKVSTDLHYCSDYEKFYSEGCRFAKKWRAKELNVLAMKPITKVENGRLLHRILNTHGIAYRWCPQIRIEDKFIDHCTETAANFDLSQRELVKWFVGIVEIVHQWPNYKPASDIGTANLSRK